MKVRVVVEVDIDADKLDPDYRQSTLDAFNGVGAYQAETREAFAKDAIDRAHGLMARRSKCVARWQIASVEVSE